MEGDDRTAWISSLPGHYKVPDLNPFFSHGGCGNMSEVPVVDVYETFKVARGMVQALQESAGRFASMDLEGPVAKFQNRVSFGVRAEIAELTTIPYIKMGNKGAFIRFKAPELKPNITSFSAVPHPNVKPMAYASNFLQMFS
ncbi:Serine/threonine-protein phosphatase 5 [Acorus calamus]|uniref:Serine/threonine-protein phosphatase 5 n=1 Tax=Acorus calamus TaxID=4465 RepID=A0AAV9DR04_ACOCL|nr:Serine/threonine-protein phosphatase 5 [Acorus calamus]